MTSKITVHVFNKVPMQCLGRLVDASEREGFRFLVRMRDEWESGKVRFDGLDEALFVAEANGDIAGVCGLTADPHANDSSIGRVRKLYVDPAYRRRGVARRLLLQLCSVAEKHFRELRVRTRGHAGSAFYESIGFQQIQKGESYSHHVVLAETKTA